VHKLQNLVDELFPRYVPEEAMSELERTSRGTENLLKGLAVAIGAEMQQAIGRLGAEIKDAVSSATAEGHGPLMEKSAELLSNALTAELVRLKEQIGSMANQFSERFNGASDGLMRSVQGFAAGAGLNIVAANHIVHLERHWNPAKEDQATDRAYRIGQTRAVTVYLPAARHPNPERQSFDEVLHGLIEKKRELQGALGLVPPQSVTDSELIDQVLAPQHSPATAAALDLATAIRLPWRLFEALVALLYERDAQRVILTPGVSDHGCDVVVLGWGAQRENVLIQCKATSHNELDSELAVREVEGSRPYYESALGVSFRQRCLHTTARRLSKRTLHAARICRISVRDRTWLSGELGRNRISLADLLAKDASRERV
jgi:Restriction endonuclease